MSLLNENGQWSIDAIKRALAHGDKNKARTAYNRAANWNERVAVA